VAASPAPPPSPDAAAAPSPPSAAGAATPAGSAAPGAAPRHGRFLDYATLAFLTLVWGTTWAAIRIGLRGIPPFTGAALRFGIAASVLLAVGRTMGVRLRPAPGDSGHGPAVSGFPWRVWLINASLTLFIPFGIFYWAEQWVPSGLASVLFATSPLWVTLVAHLVLPGERLHPARLAGVLLGFAGLALIFSQDLRAVGGPRLAGAAAIMLLAPFSSAIGVVLIKRWGAGVHPLSTAAVPMLLAGTALGCLGWVAERHRPVRFDGTSVAALLYLALVGSALAFTIYFWLLGRLPATTMSLINFMTPVAALLIGVVALDEVLTLRMVAGSGLVVGGVAAALWMGAAPPRGIPRPAPPPIDPAAAMRRR
jgi:drug/metabolite transporter (DMT)-like permease